jgi:L-aminoacid ligase-like protein
VPGKTGVLAGITGTEDWPLDPKIVKYDVAAPGKHVEAAENNDGYLAHAMVVDEEPGAAGKSARALIDSLRVAYADAGAV